MLKNIKSIYFIKFIFVYIDEKQKLKIVKCNKNLQNNIDISIINYKLFTGKYIIYESNKIGKEYYGYDDNLLFEGEYLNGKRNGNVKEYNYEDGKLIFEGEYLYDKKNKGKEYMKGKLAFQGEYLHERKWNGKGYDEKGNLIYELINGNGKIKEYNYDFNQIIYEGEYLDGNKSGKGKEYNNEGQLIYEGEFLNGERNGKGKEYSNGQLIFEGEYLNNERKK